MGTNATKAIIMAERMPSLSEMLSAIKKVAVLISPCNQRGKKITAISEMGYL